MTNLEEIQAKIKAKWDLTTNDSAKQIYSSVYDLAGEVIRIDQKSEAPGGPIPDQITNLKIENANLRAQLGALSEMGDIVEGTRTALRQREEAPEEDKTGKRLPVYAARLMAELDRCRGR